MRTIWKGQISFGLVNIPIRLYSGASTHRIDLDMLRKEDKCPIQYVRVCKKDGKEVPWDEIGKGYKYEDGDYVMLDKEDFEQARPGKSQEIEIVKFVELKDVPSQYLEKPYIVEPDKGGQKSYVLLRAALEKSGKAGLAKFVMRQKEHLALLKVEGDAILLIQMRFKEDLRDPDKLDIPGKKKPDSKELKMALSIVDGMTEKFDPENYEDTYKKDLMKLIKSKKGKGAKKKKTSKEKEPEMDEADDLLEQLKASLEAVES